MDIIVQLLMWIIVPLHLCPSNVHMTYLCPFNFNSNIETTFHILKLQINFFITIKYLTLVKYLLQNITFVKSFVVGTQFYFNKVSIFFAFEGLSLKECLQNLIFGVMKFYNNLLHVFFMRDVDFNSVGHQSSNVVHITLYIT